MIINSHLSAGNKHNTPKLIVIHAMGEYIGNQHAVGFLANLEPTPLSAHSLINSIGDNYRCRKDTEGAYHAAGFNTNSLGMEFLVEGKHTYATFLDSISRPYLTAAQYTAGVEQCKEWIDLWQINKIVRHSTLSPERKVDPGEGFPWQMFLTDVGME